MDLKLHDIPTTVSPAVQAAIRCGVDLLTVHAPGGPRILDAAVEAAGEGQKVLAVTLLTSMDEVEIRSVLGRSPSSVGEKGVRLAALAAPRGVHGVVASPRETGMLRRELDPPFLIVNPGIRPRAGKRHDQARVATPEEAAWAGADHLVLGRTVTRARNPRAVLDSVRRDVRAYGWGIPS